jgi:hypothetical protein
MGKPKGRMELLGKVTLKAKPRWVAASELGSERVSNEREHMSQCGQRASFNRDRSLADEPHWSSSVSGFRYECGLADRIKIGDHDVVTEKNFRRLAETNFGISV